MSIRPATERDASLLAKVQLDTVVKAYAGMFPVRAPTPTIEVLVNEWRTAFDDPTVQAFLATEHGSAIGTVAIRADPDNVSSGELRRLYVVPTHWERGIGSALHDTALQALRAAGRQEVGLWVLAANSRARSFYERRGWTLVPDKILEWPGLDTIEVWYERSPRADQAGGLRRVACAYMGPHVLGDVDGIGRTARTVDQIGLAAPRMPGLASDSSTEEWRAVQCRGPRLGASTFGMTLWGPIREGVSGPIHANDCRRFELAI